MRPVVDPALSPDEQARLLASPAGLSAASAAPPPAPRWGGRTPGDALLAIPVATLCGFLPAVAGWFLLGRKGLIVGAVLQAGFVAAFWGGLWLVLVAGTALQLVSWVVLCAFGGGEDDGTELARVHHGRYYLEADFATGNLRPWFGVSLRELMARAQEAVATVLESEVNTAGLLDEIANSVTLPQHEWEIGQALAELTRIGRQVQKAAAEGGGSARVREVLEPQRQALRVSAEAVTRRVEALERYAERTRGADAAYREWRTLQELEELSADTREVLARTVRDELAVAEIDGLADRAGLLPLRDSLEEARRAARVLAEPAAEQV
ncbi:hypothetical protein [Actinomadura fibrosa]|uniref:Uncharacterized protein n=1 Tax=Actinomadura fibrosa TaxID=111802 RepID=A0ABW2XM78_9ACTN